MRRRPSARILLLDDEGRVLMFRFVIKTGPCAGDDYWATPGGAVDEGETFAEAAGRELLEETGIALAVVAEPVGYREFVLQLYSGEKVIAEEQYFKMRANQCEISCKKWTILEKEIMAEYRWWSLEELQTTSEIVYPENILEMLE